ncbi:MAG: hypothetical protein RTV72_08535 [Candidatus Thorarchaeota archaeon]
MPDGKIGSLPSLEVFEEFLDDVTTTKYHHDIIDKALNVAKDIPEVEGVILKGSLGKGEGDIFSDIDFQIVHSCEPEMSAEIMKKFMDRLSEIGEVIQYFPSTAFADDRIIYIHPFVKFELSVGTCKDNSQKWHIAKSKILFDRSGLVKDIVEEARTIPFDFDDVLTIVKGRAIAIPAFTYITAGFVVRGEYIAAIEAVDWIAAEMLRISGWLLGIRNEGPRRAEQRFPEDVLSYYNGSRAKDIADVWNSLQVFLNWYTEWMVPHLEKHKIPHSLHQVPNMRGVLSILKRK